MSKDEFMGFSIVMICWMDFPLLNRRYTKKEILYFQGFKIAQTDQDRLTLTFNSHKSDRHDQVTVFLKRYTWSG